MTLGPGCGRLIINKEEVIAPYCRAVIQLPIGRMEDKMKRRLIICALVLSMLLCSCSNGSPTPARPLSPSRVRKIAEEVTLTITDGAVQEAQNPGTIRAVLANHSSVSYSFGCQFYLEMLYNDTWQEVKFDTDPTYPAVMQVAEPDRELDEEYSLSYVIKGALDAGTYRIVVQVDSETNGPEFVTAEFTAE